MDRRSGEASESPGLQLLRTFRSSTALAATIIPSRHLEMIGTTLRSASAKLWYVSPSFTVRRSSMACRFCNADKGEGEEASQLGPDGVHGNLDKLPWRCVGWRCWNVSTALHWSSAAERRTRSYSHRLRASWRRTGFWPDQSNSSSIRTKRRSSTEVQPLDFGLWINLFWNRLCFFSTKTEGEYVNVSPVEIFTATFSEWLQLLCRKMSCCYFININHRFQLVDRTTLIYTIPHKKQKLESFLHWQLNYD